ncbi:hypothetical protein R3W88_025867 [Solanum pinnatisectum]|uniref:Glycosyltransferase n=1 Tax=Solanum pinnatisectum TaxID=50273 RepID=A0AAV9M4V8_9SOLN|nr:hypothetical protein R3W88_025867 [Solanum pinnatisectum]
MDTSLFTNQNMKNLKNEKSHVLIALFPGQGQINPCIGVTLTMSLSTFSKIKKGPNVEALSFTPFFDFHLFYSSVKPRGSKFIFNLIQSNAKNGTPFSHVIYTIIMEWVGLVAKKINIPSTLFWIQPATVFDVYYYRFTNYSDYFKNYDAKDRIIELPGLLHLSSNWAVKSIKRQIEMLSSEKKSRVLVNTFDALKILKHVTMISSKNYMDWLNSMDKGSVIYIAFVSYSEISNGEQVELQRKLEKQGKIVSWCSQVDVLKHPSVGCFLTHREWNLTLESIASKIPIVACPLRNDQVCNAKLIQDIWRNGVRVNVSEKDVVERDEFSRCITIAMGDGEEGEELRRNAKKWSDLAKEAMKENGTSTVNLKAFANEILFDHSKY